jgi:hypothetical protein
MYLMGTYVAYIIFSYLLSIYNRDTYSMNTSTEVEWPNTAVIPCGKYKGQPISVLYGNPAYIHFLLTLKWFKNKYPELRAAIVGSNPESAVIELRAENEWLRGEILRLRSPLAGVAANCSGNSAGNMGWPLPSAV